MSLPQNLPLNLMQTQWATQINPLLKSPIANGQQLNSVSLINGTTVVNHMLGRALQGYIVVGSNAAATIHDTQASNQTPQLTLVLVSSAAVNVNLWVY